MQGDDGMDPEMKHIELRYYSDEQLKDELERRQQEREAVPQILKDYDSQIIVDFLEGEIKRANETGRLSKDLEHYLYEHVIITFYGENALKWFSDRQ